MKSITDKQTNKRLHAHRLEKYSRYLSCIGAEKITFHQKRLRCTDIKNYKVASFLIKRRRKNRQGFFLWQHLFSRIQTNPALIISYNQPIYFTKYHA